MSPPSSTTHLRHQQSLSHDLTDSNVLIVDWNGADDLENPKNWSSGLKWRTTVIVSLFTFLSPVSSSMIAPASLQLAEEFGIKDKVLIAMSTSIFVLRGPMSEIYGRMRVFQLSNIFYLIWNFACGWARNTPQILHRLLLAGGILSDMFSAEERGKAIALFSLAPLLGPVIGPIAGGWIAEKTTWRWVFHSTSALTVLIQLAGLIWLRETYAPYLLSRKASAMLQEQKRSMNAGTVEKGVHVYTSIRSVYEKNEVKTVRGVLKTGLSRPFRFMASESIIQVLGIYMAFVYGLLYIFLTTIPTIFSTVYNQRVGIASLHYLALGVGVSGASQGRTCIFFPLLLFISFYQINARYMDRIYIFLKAKKGNGKGQPEFRLPSMLPGVLMTPIGLFITGWTARADVHWIGVDIGVALVGAGTILNFQSIQVYLVDCYTIYAASALAAASFLRSLCGFGFPLFAPYMYDAVGYGWGCTILALFSIVIGVPAPFVFWKYGKMIRGKSRWMVQDS
ncbi:MFS general substrate transporter [Flagelloscypha sp. PMI_526]|nr:MFS general substrate transporter [Flagelloscypha sp. PMI_526]